MNNDTKAALTSLQAYYEGLMDGGYHPSIFVLDKYVIVIERGDYGYHYVFNLSDVVANYKKLPNDNGIEDEGWFDAWGGLVETDDVIYDWNLTQVTE